MPKLKTHKGLSKRIKVTARGKVKHKQAGTSHLAHAFNGKKTRQKRRPRYVSQPVVNQLEPMMHRKLKARDRDH